MYGTNGKYFAFVIDLSFDIGGIHSQNIAYYSAKGFFYCIFNLI